MEATEVKELIDETIEEVHEKESGSKASTAIYISILAAVLAVVSMLGSNVSKDMMASAIDASDTYAYYQAKTLRQVSLRLAADQLDLLSDEMTPDGKTRAAAKAADYRKTADRMDSSDDVNSRQTLIERAKHADERRNRAAEQDPYFDFAEALLQIAIVLASVFVITGARMVMWISYGLAVTGILLGLDGLTLLVPLPFL